MRVVSFDIGIINMAVCLIETDETKKPHIRLWEILDTAQIPKCSHCTKKAKSYTAIPKSKDPDAKYYYCASHHKSIAEKQFTSRQIKSIKDTKDMDLDYLGSNLYHLLESYPQLTENIDWVLFENQPVLKNPKMKSVQMILYSYFLHKKVLSGSSIRNLKFYTARRKLEIQGISLDQTNFDKKQYSDRKSLGKLITKELLQKLGEYEQLEKLLRYEKQDDLCDAFVQGIEHLQTQGELLLAS